MIKPGSKMPPPPAALSAVALVAAVLSTAAPQAAAQGADNTRVRDWAAACANCHGPAGRAPAGSPVPGLAGRPHAELVAQMQSFKTGARPATVMHQLAKGYSDEQIAAIAAWFAAVK